MKSKEASKILSVTVRPETTSMISELCEKYHLSKSAIVTIAVVELHGARLSPPPERKKRGNGHS